MSRLHGASHPPDLRKLHVDQRFGATDEEKYLGVMSGKSIAERLVATWELVEWSVILPDGSKVFPLGEHAVGQIVYTEDGHVAAQLVAIERRRFDADDWREASKEEAARAFKE